MNPPRATAEDYIQFLIATPSVASATEAARAQPARPDAPAHDAFTRLLHRLEPDPTALWDEAQPAVRPGGALVLDDSVLDKPFARHMGLVGRCWSGRHRRVVAGIGLVTLLWTDGAALVPCDYRLADPIGDETKNDHFRAMLVTAKGRDLSPRVVLFDTWYSGKDNLKAVRAHGWHFLTRVRCNRRVNPDRTGNRAIAGCDIAAAGTVVHLEGFGLVKAFRIAAGDGGTEHGITNDLDMDGPRREVLAGHAWALRSTTGASSSTATWTGARCAWAASRPFTSAWRSARSCDWSGIGSSPGSVGSPPKPRSFVTRCGVTLPRHDIAFRKKQLRKS